MVGSAKKLALAGNEQLSHVSNYVRVISSATIFCVCVCHKGLRNCDKILIVTLSVACATRPYAREEKIPLGYVYLMLM